MQRGDNTMQACKQTAFLSLKYHLSIKSSWATLQGQKNERIGVDKESANRIIQKSMNMWIYSHHC